MVIPNTDYTVGIYTFTRPGVTSGDGGMMVSMSREFLGSLTGAVARMRLVMVGADGSEVSRQAQILGGILTDKSGAVVTESYLTCEWPGEADGQGGRRALRPDSLRLELDVLQPLRTRIQFDAVKASASAAKVNS